MRSFCGSVIVVLGVVLIGMGLDGQNVVSSWISNLLNGLPADRSIWLLAGGGLAVVAGIATAVTGRRRRERLS